jgi:hypothetical protein
VDGGLGILITNTDVPESTSSVNFTPQGGFGFSVWLTEAMRLETGVRWRHISNGFTADSNPGRESLLIHAGVSLPF